MITTFDIKGFKSVRDVHLDCRRINLFIGAPNTGKSNILEALAFLSYCARGGELRDYVRLEQTQNLFYDGLVEKGSWRLALDGKINIEIDAEYAEGVFLFSMRNSGMVLRIPHQVTGAGGAFIKQLDFVKFYRFKRAVRMSSSELGSLLPPDGQNLVALVYSSKKLRQLAADYFAPFGLQLVIKPSENKLEVQKQSEGVAVSFPYELSSDTLQRMLFYSVAIESNREAALVFEEPEAHAFPYFTKHLGERIALDENKNQFFIATHNPYLLTAVVEKAPAADVAVFATYYRNYETRVKLLAQEDLALLFEQDPFLGIEHLLEDAP